MFLERGTGVPNYIGGLYRACLKLDTANQYVFLQPETARTLGQTVTARAPRGLTGAVWFDTVQTDRLIAQTAPAVFHGPSHILPWRKRPGVKYAVTIHDLAYLVLPQQYSLLHRSYYHWQVARSVRVADAIVAISHNTKRDIVRYYRIDPSRVEVVHNGVADQFFASAQTRPPRVMEGAYFFSVTTHPQRKNVLGAVRAFAQFARHTDVKYVVAGLMGEPQRREILDLAQELGVREKVIIFGYADDAQLISLYQNATSTIYPSFYEGFGLPVVEAMACGCPVIAANTSSLPEILTDPAWLVDPYNVADIAAKMRAALALSPEARANVGRANAERARQFTWDQAAVRMAKIFEGLAASTGGGRGK